MKIGILGPSDWQSRIDEFSAHADVLWGTDEPQRVGHLLSHAAQIDAVVVHGSSEFLTSEVTEACGSRRIEIFALAPDSPEVQWIDRVAGVVRISHVDQIVPRVDPKPIVESDCESAQRPTGKIVAVWGPIGAPGISSVAIALAALAARHENRVILCDADTRGASLAIGLGLIDEVPGFASACRLSGRNELTIEHIQRLAIPLETAKGSIAVLTGLPRASRWVEIAPPKIRGVLDCARSLAEVVVIDVGFGIEENEWVDGAPQRDGAARAVIADADVVVAVGLSDATGIARLIRGLDELSGICASPLVVLNQTTRQSAREATDAIARFTNHRVVATIPRDTRGGLEDALSKSPGSAREVWDAVATALAGGVEPIER